MLEHLPIFLGPNYPPSADPATWSSAHSLPFSWSGSFWRIFGSGVVWVNKSATISIWSVFQIWFHLIKIFNLKSYHWASIGLGNHMIKNVPSNTVLILTWLATSHPHSPPNPAYPSQYDCPSFRSRKPAESLFHRMDFQSSDGVSFFQRVVTWHSKLEEVSHVMSFRGYWIDWLELYRQFGRILAHMVLITQLCFALHQ